MVRTTADPVRIITGSAENSSTIDVSVNLPVSATAQTDYYTNPVSVSINKLDLRIPDIKNKETTIKV